MHMSLQCANALNAVGGLLVGTVAVIILAFVGAMMWEIGTQKADWSARVAAFGFWFAGGSSVVTAISLSLAPFHWWSPAQDTLFGHLVLASWIFSSTMLMGGMVGGMLMDGTPGRRL